MALFVIAFFFVVLIVLIGLFFFKQWELEQGRVVAPQFRARADKEALRLKELIEAGRKDLEHIPPLLLYAAQSTLHGIAVDAAHAANWFSGQAHRLADAVSHKRNFQRLETRSEFLKKVAEHKNGNGENGASRV